MPAEVYALLFTGLLAASVTKPLPQAADPEMLEFIGAFETRGGQWLDPLSLEDREPEGPQPAREEKKHE